MADFGAAAELSVELAPGEAAAVRQELEDELSDIGIGAGAGAGGAAGALGAGGGSALTDGGADALAGQLADQTELLEDILDELEAGGIGGGGGGGGGGFDPLSFLAGRGLGGGRGGGGSSFLTAVIAAAGRSGAATAITLPQFGVRTQGGIDNPGAVNVPGIDLSDQDLSSIYDQAGVDFQGGGSNPIQQVFNTGPSETSSENIIRSIFTQSPGDGGAGGGGSGGSESTGPSRQNRAKENRQQQFNPTINVDVTVEQTRQALEQAIRDAKRQAAREVAQEVNQNIPGTTSRTGL